MIMSLRLVRLGASREAALAGKGLLRSTVPCSQTVAKRMNGDGQRRTFGQPRNHRQTRKIWVGGHEWMPAEQGLNGFPSRGSWVRIPFPAPDLGNQGVAPDQSTSRVADQAEAHPPQSLKILVEALLLSKAVGGCSARSVGVYRSWLSRVRAIVKDDASSPRAIVLPAGETACPPRCRAQGV